MTLTFDQLAALLGVDTVRDEDNPHMQPAVAAYEAFARRMEREAAVYRALRDRRRRQRRLDLLRDAGIDTSRFDLR